MKVLTPAQYEFLLRRDLATFAGRCFQDLNPQTCLATEIADRSAGVSRGSSEGLKRWAGRSWGGRLRPAGTPSHWGNALGVAVDIGSRPSQVGSETT
jgi:hypothetical protein